MKGFLHMTKKKIMPVLIAICLIIIVIGIIGLSALIKKYTPSKETEDLNKYFNITSDDQIAVTLDDTVSEYKATSIDGKIYVDYNFVNKYIKFLSSGGSMDPLDELKIMDIDLSKKEVIDKAMDKFNEYITEFSKIYQEVKRK